MDQQESLYRSMIDPQNLTMQVDEEPDMQNDIVKSFDMKKSKK